MQCDYTIEMRKGTVVRRLRSKENNAHDYRPQTLGQADKAQTISTRQSAAACTPFAAKSRLACDYLSLCSSLVLRLSESNCRILTLERERLSSCSRTEHKLPMAIHPCCRHL